MPCKAHRGFLFFAGDSNGGRTMADDLQDAVDAALTAGASNPKSFTVDGQSHTFRDLKDLIDLDNHSARKSGHRFGFAMRTIIPPEH